jgi:hypothetical protein
MTDIRRMERTRRHGALLSARPDSNQQGIYSTMITAKYDVYWSGNVMRLDRYVRRSEIFAQDR